MIEQINSKNFANYSKQEKDIKSKIFLYSDRDILDEEIEFNDKKYGLDDPTDIDLPGQIEDPLHSISRTLFEIYEWSLLKASFCDGYLLCYLDFIPGSQSDAKQLQFRVYKLNAIKFRRNK